MVILNFEKYNNGKNKKDNFSEWGPQISYIQLSIINYILSVQRGPH